MICALFQYAKEGGESLMELFKLLGTIAISNSDANDALDDTTEKGESAREKLSGAFSKIGSAAVAVGKTIATGIAVGSTALAGLTAKALSASGELEQNLGGSESVFKESAEKMQKEAQQAFGKMGLATSDYLATANKMGALFQGAGFEIEASADMSADAMQRAADVASIMGIDVNAAMEAVAGMAKGNFTMMDNLGVAINDTTLQIYAQEKGLGELETTQDKVNAAYQLFMEKSAYAAGNYAKENASLAGSINTTKAALTNFLDGSGKVEDVVSSVSNLANVVVKNINQIFPALVQGITQLVTQLAPIIPGLINQLLPGLITGAVSLINGLVAALPSIVSALMSGIPALLQGIVQIFNVLVAAFPGLVEILVQALPTLLPQLIEGLVAMIVLLCTNFATIIQPIIDALPDIIVAVVNALLNNLPALLEGIVALVAGIVLALPEILVAVWDALATLFAEWGPKVSEWFSPIWDGIVQWLSDLWASIVEFVQPVIDWVKGLFEKITEAFHTVVDPWIEIFKRAWSLICEKFSEAVAKIKKVFEPVGKFFQNIWSGIKSAFGNVTSWFSDVFTKAWTAVKNVFSKGGKIFDGIKDGIANVFKTVVNGIIGGINKVIKVPFDAINTMLRKIRGISILGVSPFSWIQEFSVPQIPLLAKGGVLEKGQVGLLEGNGAEAVVPLENNQKWISRVADDMSRNGMGNVDRDTLVRAIIEAIRAVIPELQQTIRVVPDENGIFRIVRDKAREYTLRTGNPAMT